jgi:two-component system chemotaxis response regulator CheB
MIPPAPPSSRIRVLVVDDSPFMRGVVRQSLASDPQVEVVGLVGDGIKAVEAVGALAPDVVAMDVEGSQGDGLMTVARIMTERPTPILVIGTETRQGSEVAIQALELGAVDFVTRPSEDAGAAYGTFRDAVIRKVKLVARVRPVRPAAAPEPRPLPPDRRPDTEPRRREPRERPAPCAVIAASTGGPAALSSVIPGLPEDLAGAVVVVQHLPAAYTAQLARALGARAALPVKEAEDGEPLVRGVVYVAPGARNLTVSPRGAIVLRPAARNAGVCPSANLAMTSVARYAGPRSVGVVLTGAGRDGAEGAAAIRRAGGAVMAQDETSSLVYGMPRAAIETGCVDAVVPLRRVSDAVTTRLLTMAPVAGAARGDGDAEV